MSAILVDAHVRNANAPAAHISDLMRQRIQSYLSARSDPSLYQSVRNMSQFVSDDYGNRFLIELIQNAHDAHDPSSVDGEIAVVLDPSEGEHGCLYVANRGNGFVGANLMAITNIALSSKPVNAGIGNKGLGFRSVLQVCTWPEIYSVDGFGGRGEFDGYCFRFATVDDLAAELGPESADLAQEMEQNLPCWHVPVPAKPGFSVARFASDGFATVVRLPLKSDDALHAVRTELNSLLGLKTPLQLFLSRVGRISIDPGSGQHIYLERTVSQASILHPPGFTVESPITVERLRLGTEEYAVAHWDIDEKIFQAALQASLEKGEVPESWKHWEGAARVSVAVPLGTPLDKGRLYCFLPLGEEGGAPFAGYINANFYTKMDRRTVDASIRLNEMFMRMAAWVSCQLIGFLVKEAWSGAPSAVVSLLCWDSAYHDQLKHGMGDSGQGILLREFLPVRGTDETIAWASPKEAYGWVAPPGACLSPKRVCEVGGGRLLLDSLTPNQRAALDRLYLCLRGSDFKPPARLIADWVEKIAGKLHEESAEPARWAVFYDEVAEALAAQPAVLFGKRFLLSVSGDLISSELPTTTSPGRGRRAADVYFAPVMSVDADIDDDDSKNSLPLESLPATLRRGFALLSRDVPWLKDDGGHRLGRTFLISGKLAREYDTRDVLRTLAGVTRTAAADKTRIQALEWAFRLWNSGRSLSDKETRAAAFCVPTAEGWISAEAAMFGAGWDVPNGRKLQSLLKLGAEGSADLRQSLTRLLPEFSAWPIRHGAQSDWVRFLTAAGVADCLRPIGGETVSLEPSGTPPNLVLAVSRAVSGLAELLRAHWRIQLTKDCSRMYSTRSYRAEIRPWRIPGQGDIEIFPPEIRRDYAVQIVVAMRSFTDEHRSFRAMRADSGAVSAEQHRLSTPLHAFLTGAEWMPVVRPGGLLRFVKPQSAWHFVGDDERPPRFMDFVANQVAAVLDPTTLQWLREHSQLGIFDDEQDAERALRAMAEASMSGISDVRDVRRYQDLFRRLWVTARRSGQPSPGQYVPVMVGDEIAGISADGDITLAYFDDERDPLKMRLLEEIGEPVFDFVRGDQDAAWQWVNSSAPGRFRRISEEPAEVFIDGIKFDDTIPTRPLADVVGSWIVDFLVCVAEYKATSFVKATQNTLGRVRRAAMNLAVITGREILIAHGEDRMALPSSLHGALTLVRPGGHVLIVQTPLDSLSLDLLASAAGQLASALGSREFAHGLEAALLRLASALREHPGEAPDDMMVAAALGVEAEAIKRTRRLASGDLISLLDLAIPLSACLSSEQTTARLQELAALEDPDHEELRAALECLAVDLGIPLGQMEERLAGLVDLRDLKAEFDLPIARLNAVIANLGARHKPVSNEHHHREAWLRYLRLQQPVTVELLRERSAGAFDRGEALTGYASYREKVLNVAPDAMWFTAYDELPDVVMEAHLTRWIDEHVPLDMPSMPLDVPLNEARSLNGTRLRIFTDTFAPVLGAWVHAPGVSASNEVREAWASPTAARETCHARARDGGWLDFRPLDDDAIARWLTLEGIWPAGRAANPELAAWGLSATNVVSSEERAKAERAELQRRKSQVEFGGATFSALKDDYADIAAAVDASLTQATALQNVISSDAALVSLDTAKPSGGSGSGSGRGTPKSPENAMSDDQKIAVGLIGELWAREWIRRRHNVDAVGESMWVSRYRDLVLNTSGGLDLLGYDFIVTTKSRTYYYEVKASMGDPRRFEMGPTEIGAAQRYRADRDHRYRILYLAYVGDPSRMTPSLLANPFSAKGEGKFRAVGRGSVTYEFDPAES
ncbi:MAG: hypothetical protein K0M48_05930 [Thiobacillus sp.]|nr:hypothetical protein [Thiobacillus sp.]